MIATITIFSVLGVALMSLTTSSTFNQMASNGANRAYYLAEAGMRYSASEFRSATDEEAKDDKLENLHGETFTLGNDGSFQLNIFPWYFRTTSDPSASTTLSAEFPGGKPLLMNLPNSGYLKIRNETVPRLYNSYNINGSDISFTMASALPSYTLKSSILPVGRAQSGTLSRGGNITLSSGYSSFPLTNGTFTVGTASSTTGSTNDVYAYLRRNDDTLENVFISTDRDQNFSLSVPSNAYVTAMKFVELESTGTFGAGSPLEASRTVSYSIPIGWVSGEGIGQKTEFHDKFNDLSHWFTGSNQGQLGSHAIRSVDSDNALSVTGTASPGWDLFGLFERSSLIMLNWGSTQVDLNQSWALADYLLSYDAQVKIRANGQDYYMPGIVFRIDSSGQMYGVSFLRANTGGFIDRDRVPDDLCPLNRTPMIVLWQQKPADNPVWIAYKTLSAVDGVVNSSGRLVDWSTLLVRVIEADSLQFNDGQTEFRYGDIVTGSSSGATAVVNGTPILTAGSWTNNNAAGWLTVTNVTKSSGTIQFQSGENLLVDGAVKGRYTGTSRQKDNYIRAYYGKISATGTASDNPLDNNRLANPRIISSSNLRLKWPVDDVSDWASSNDAFTLVQWDSTTNFSVTGGDAARLGTGKEQNAIIRTNALTTPNSGVFSRPEIGLDTWGSSSTSVYFDDFGIQTASPGQTQGFLPAIQQ
jgi:hypothetical protein